MSGSRNTTERLAIVLEALGDNAENVADLLQFGGWRGLPRDPNFCPVARYLRTVVHDVSDVAVGSERAMVHTADGKSASVVLSPAIAGFVLVFDLGAYPTLVATTDDNGAVIDDFEL